MEQSELHGLAYISDDYESTYMRFQPSLLRVPAGSASWHNFLELHCQRRCGIANQPSDFATDTITIRALTFVPTIKVKSNSLPSSTSG
jgi:hypothetical protein